MMSVAMVVAAGTNVQAADVAQAEAIAKQTANATIELPLLSGWYEGKLVYYITTDITDKGMAEQSHNNYVPRLKQVLRPPVPGQGSAVDRVYKFPNFDQGSVFPSAPKPAGAGSTSTEYTPIWVVYMVNWLPGTTPHVLHSEEEVMDAEEHKLVSISPTDIVVNCPILFFAEDAAAQRIKIRP